MVLSFQKSDEAILLSYCLIFQSTFLKENIVLNYNVTKRSEWWPQCLRKLCLRQSLIKHSLHYMHKTLFTCSVWMIRKKKTEKLQIKSSIKNWDALVNDNCILQQKLCYLWKLYSVQRFLSQCNTHFRRHCICPQYFLEEIK